MKSVRARHLTVKALGLPAVLLGWIEEIRTVLIEEQLRSPRQSPTARGRSTEEQRCIFREKACQEVLKAGDERKLALLTATYRVSFDN
jgi:hypothetical protein